MQQEIEVKFLGLDFDELRKKLGMLGGTCKQPMQIMKRTIMDYLDQSLRNSERYWAWIRVRDEGNRIQVKYKQVAKQKGLETHEIEYEASSYENVVETFEAIGLKVWSEQESRRETWECMGCEIMFDEWPWLDPYIEIEGPSEKVLQELATSLGLKWSEHILGGVDILYRQKYAGMTAEETVGDIPRLTFEKLPEWLEERQS